MNPSRSSCVTSGFGSKRTMCKIISVRGALADGHASWSGDHDVQAACRSDGEDEEDREDREDRAKLACPPVPWTVA